MKKLVYEYEFVDALVSDEYASFSREGAIALYNYIEETYDENYEFDSVAIRCTYSEYNSLKECLNNYDNINTLEELVEHTAVIPIPNSNKLIIEDF
tara:strand:- start:649 stop:936 length:288 start_codon:yes stop_codon:yes gene_type:complete